LLAHRGTSEVDSVRGKDGFRSKRAEPIKLQIKSVPEPVGAASQASPIVQAKPQVIKPPVVHKASSATQGRLYRQFNDNQWKAQELADIILEAARMPSPK